MSDDENEFVITQAWLAEARQVMADKKLLGTWDYAQGDEPIDVSAGPLPVGLRSLSDLAHVLIDLAWIKNPPAADPADPHADEFRAAVIRQMGSDFVSGRIVVVSPLGWPPVSCAVPVSAWVNLLAEPGGQINLMQTITYSRLTGEAFGSAYSDQTAAVSDETFASFNDDLIAAVIAAQAERTGPPPGWAPQAGQSLISWVAPGGPAETEAISRIQRLTEGEICRALVAMAYEGPPVFKNGYPTLGSIKKTRHEIRAKVKKDKA